MSAPVRSAILTALSIRLVSVVAAQDGVLSEINPETGLEEITIPLPGLPEDAKPLRMVLIPAGTFTMGSPLDEPGRRENEWAPHSVTITRPFYMGKYPVTQAQWRAIDPETALSSWDTWNDRPANGMSWSLCQGFIGQLNGLGFGYFRMPSEAEWEYACRAGTETAYSFGNESALPAMMDMYRAWLEGNYYLGAYQVELLYSNPWGLFDMQGNVEEWCSDCWEWPYERDAQADPQGPSSGFFHVTRGAEINSTLSIQRSAARNRFGVNAGLRLVREHDPLFLTPTPTPTPTTGRQPGVVLVPEDYDTIDAAIQASSQGNVISIAPNDGGYIEHIGIQEKSVTLTGRVGMEIPVVGIPASEDSFLEGFDPRHSLLISNASVTIWGLYIAAGLAGQGMVVSNSNLYLDECKIEGKTSIDMGLHGIFLPSEGEPGITIQDCMEKICRLEDCLILGGNKGEPQRETVAAFLIHSSHDSTISVERSEIYGGHGFATRRYKGTPYTYPGAAAMAVIDCHNISLFSNSALLSGGSGSADADEYNTYYYETLYAKSRNGGDGLLVIGSTISLTGGTFCGGLGGVVRGARIADDDRLGYTFSGGTGGAGIAAFGNSHVVVRNSTAIGGNGGPVVPEPAWTAIPGRPGDAYEYDGTSSFDVESAFTSTPTPTDTPTVTPTPTLIPAEHLESIIVELSGLPEGARPLEMVRVPAGVFHYGSPLDEIGRDTNYDYTVREESIDDGFYLGTYELTQAQWRAVASRSPSGSGSSGWQTREWTDGDDFPVYRVSIHESSDFIRAINELGLGVFRLPSEREWEYACRASSMNTRFSFGDALECDSNEGYCESLDRYMWWAGNYRYGDNPYGRKETGLKLPNPWGFFDMHGNVTELCAGWWRPPSYYAIGVHMPTRGGCYRSPANECRSASRDYGIGYEVFDRWQAVGLRLVREIDEPVSIPEWKRH